MRTRYGHSCINVKKISSWAWNYVRKLDSVFVEMYILYERKRGY